MTFHQQKKGNSRLGIIIISIFIMLAIVLFFSLNTCKKKGFMRSAKSSDANYLYQVYPSSVNGSEYFICLEGVFKTQLVETNGGVTMRRGSTDIRLSLHDLSSGKLINRKVLGNYEDLNSSIIGTRDSVFWMYNNESGIHARSLFTLDEVVTQSQLMESNQLLNKGLAMAQTGLANLSELYFFNREHNALMLTTVEGKRVWIDGTSLQTITPSFEYEANSDYNEIIEQLLSDAQLGQTIKINAITDKIIHSTTTGNRFSINHTSTQVVGFDSCTYAFKGNTIKTLHKSNCPTSNPIESLPNNDNQFIEANFLVNGISLNKDFFYTDKDYTPVNTSNKAPIFYLWHKNKISEDAHRIISKYDYQQEKTVWQFDATAILGIDAEIARIYTRKNTLLVILKTHIEFDDNFTCVSINTDTGNMEWVFNF
jgi:hypothetical protein